MQTFTKRMRAVASKLAGLVEKPILSREAACSVAGSSPHSSAVVYMRDAATPHELVH